MIPMDSRSDLTKEILEEKGFEIDEEGFHKCMEVQRETARNARKNHQLTAAKELLFSTIWMPLSSSLCRLRHRHPVSPKVLFLTQVRMMQTQALYRHWTEGGTIITEETPFYATSGGQLADTGVISGHQRHLRWFHQCQGFRQQDRSYGNGDNRYVPCW